MKTFVACFMGQGGYATSFGIWGQIAPGLRGIGCTVEVYRYVDGQVARSRLDQYRRADYACCAVGYSLGTSTVTWLQAVTQFNLACCIAMSDFEVTYPINHKNVKRAVLWHGSEIDPLSGAGEELGFDLIHWMPSIPLLGHLAMQSWPSVVNGVVAEVKGIMK
jgi:hypothetical protein